LKSAALYIGCFQCDFSEISRIRIPDKIQSNAIVSLKDLPIATGMVVGSGADLLPRLRRVLFASLFPTIDTETIIAGDNKVPGKLPGRFGRMMMSDCASAA
jgi:hypothetical protein